MGAEMKVKAEENGYGEGTAGQAHRLDGTLVAPRAAAAATNEQRVAYLNSLGWQVEPEPVETLSLTLPKELEEPYLSYNVLQRAQGFDLEPCCGKTVERCTYTVKNHPSGKVCQADLYICGGEIVAGDILCTGEGGFIAPLAFPKDA